MRYKYFKMYRVNKVLRSESLRIQNALTILDTKSRKVLRNFGTLGRKVVLTQ